MAAHGLDPQRLDADQHGLDHVPADRLDLGSGRLSWLPRLPRLPALPRGARGGSSAWWRAAGLLAVGGLLGWGAHAVVDPVPAAPHRPTGPSLVAGSLQHHAARLYGAGFVLSLTNSGRTTVEVVDAGPQGWVASAPPVRLSPGQAAEVPVAVSVDCPATQQPTDVVVLRVLSGASPRTVDLSVPGLSALLEQQYLRLCSVGTLTPPTRNELLGAWKVADGGPAFSGRLVIRFRPDGSYSMDAGVDVFRNTGAVGSFTLRGARLALTRLRGGDCGGPRRSVWHVGLLDDGRLHIRQLRAFDGFCAVRRGDVWIASRFVS